MANVVLFTDFADPLFTKQAGPYRVATQLRDHGFTVQVIEHIRSWPLPQLEEAIRKFVGKDTLFLGFNTTFLKPDGNTFGVEDITAARLIGWAKKQNPDVKLVVGGANAVRTHDHNVDFYVSGYADDAITALAYHLRDGSSIEGMRLQNGSLYVDAQRYYSVETFHHGIRFEPQDIVDEHTPLPVEIARGCVFKCSFCAFPLNGKKRNDYMRDFGDIRAELIRNYEMYGTKTYLFVDDTYNDALDKVEGMANMIATLPFQPRWTSFSRLDIMYTEKNQPMRELILESGASAISFGIETMNHETGKKIGKGMHPEKTVEALQWCRDLWGDRILTQSNLIIGLPGESIDSIYNTYNMMVKPDFPLHNFHFGAYTMFPKVLFPTQVFTSRIEAKPDHFGYIHSPDGNWRNEFMDRRTARRIERELNSSDEANKRISVAGIRYPAFKMIMAPEDETWKMSRYDLRRSDYRLKLAMRIRRYIDSVLAF